MARRDTFAVLYLAAVSTGLLSPLFPQHPAFASVEAACTNLADAGSPLLAGLVTAGLISEDTLKDLPLDQVFGGVNTNLPWLSQCVASIDLMTVYTQVISSTTLTGCLKTLNSTMSSTDENMLTTDAFKNTICPLYKNTIIPCAIDGVVDIAVRALATSDGCCDALTTKIAESFGNDLKTMVNLLLQYVGNVICAQKTSSSNSSSSSSTPQYCGVSLLSAFGGSQGDMMTMFNFGQIPNAQACNAMAGSSFVNTLGAKTTLPFASSADIGICFQPVDLLLQHVRDYPIMKSYTLATGTTDVPLSNLFAADKCVQGDVLVDWLTLPTNPLMTFVGAYDALMTAYTTPSTASTDAPGGSSYDGESPWPDSHSNMNMTMVLATSLGSMKSAAKAFCFHLPNSAACAYSGQKIAYPYTEVATAAGISAATSNSNSVPVHQSSSLLAVMVTMAFGFVLSMLTAA